MKTKKWIKWTSIISIPILVATVGLGISSCAKSTNNDTIVPKPDLTPPTNKPENKYKPTKVNENLLANQIGLENQTVNEVINSNTINSELVYKYRSVLLIGDNNITNENQIIVHSPIKTNNEIIKVEIILKANSWYNESGDLARVDSNPFIFNISGFRKEPTVTLKQPTILKSSLLAVDLGLESKTTDEVISNNLINNKLIFNNFSKIVSGDHNVNKPDQIIVSEITKGNDPTTLTFKVVLKANTWYNKEGLLSTIDSNKYSINVNSFKEPPVINQKYPTNLEELRNTDPNWLAQQPQYDSRKFNIVRESVENQVGFDTCWAFCTAAASETSILKEGINPKYVPETLPANSGDKITININELNIDYVTNVRTKQADLLGLNQEDLYQETLNAGNYIDYPGNALMQWNGVANNAYSSSSEYKYDTNGPFVLEGYEIVPNKIDAIKKAVAKYGAVGFSYNVKQGKDWQYLLAESDENSTKGATHASAIIGWDDSIAKENFKYYDGSIAKSNGAWIVRNSWGDASHNNGYFYLSYESVIGHFLTAFNYANRTDYNNNYYWDGMNNGFFRNQFLDEARNNDVAAVFPVLKASYNKKEFLKAVNATIKGNDVKLDVKVYKNLKDKTIPDSGELVFSNTTQYENSGCYTVQLDNLVQLEPNSYYSVVMKAYNNTNDAYIALNTDLSKNDLTFYKEQNNKWANCLKLSDRVAKIKAFTVTEDTAGTHNNDLQFSNITLNKYSARYDEINTIKPVSVKLEDKLLRENIDYRISYKKKLTRPDYDIADDNEIIGEGYLVIEGINDYHGTKTASFSIIVALLPSSFPNGITYDPNTRKCYLDVNSQTTNYNQIQLPPNWRWTYPNQQIKFDQVDNYVEYYAPDAWCYRKSFFDVIPRRI